MKIKQYALFVALFLTSFLLSLGYGIYANKTSFLTLTYNYPNDSFTNFQEGEILAGSKITAEIKSLDNNLGIVGVRFLANGKVSSDSFIFRLKEKGTGSWYYVNTYEARKFGGYEIFPFGFPIIENSKDKKYYIELESLKGKVGKAAFVSKKEPAIVTIHKFTKNKLVNNKKELVIFLFKKGMEVTGKSNLLGLTILIYLVLVSPFILRRFLPSKGASRSVKKLKAISKNGVYWTLPFIALSRKILRFIGKMILSFYKWLGQE